MTYTITQAPDGFRIVLPDGTVIAREDGSPFATREEAEEAVRFLEREMNWIKCSERLPPVDEVVMTKLDDAKGCRNEQKLKRFQRTPETRSLWFLEDGSMYVYYTSTHWRPLEERMKREGGK